jgi:hypothetical protein
LVEMSREGLLQGAPVSSRDRREWRERLGWRRATAAATATATSQHHVNCHFTCLCTKRLAGSENSYRRLLHFCSSF